MQANARQKYRKVALQTSTGDTRFPISFADITFEPQRPNEPFILSLQRPTRMLWHKVIPSNQHRDHFVQFKKTDVLPETRASAGTELRWARMVSTGLCCLIEAHAVCMIGGEGGGTYSH